jgi:hypothetical protein
MCEIEVELECFRDEFVLGKLPAVIGSEGVHFVLDRPQEFADLLANGLCRSPRHLSKQGETRFSLRHREQGVLWLFAKQGVHFPVAQAFSGVHAGRALFNRAAIGQLAAPIIASVAFATFLLAPQMLVQIASGLLVCQNMLVDPP